jgi:hypothetical protein
MDLFPFQLKFRHRNKLHSVEVRPCCNEENVIYYDIWMENLYQFTITPGLINEEKPGWRIALKNADKAVDNELIQALGVEIESHYL